MRNERAVPMTQDDVFSPHYLPADVCEKFAVSERRRRKHFWIWTLVVSTLLTMMGVAIWLANKM